MKHFPPVAITGATGTQGGALARLLLARNQPVRCLTRNPASPAAQALASAGAEVVPGDFNDPASLEAAMAGSSAVFLMSTPFGTDHATETRQAVAVIDAAVRAGVPQLVFSSVTHADRATGVPHFDSKYLVEQHLAATTLNWTVIGPGKFMDNYLSERAMTQLRDGRLTLPLIPDQPVAYVCADDIAAMAALAIAEPGRLARRRIDIAGCEITPTEEAAAFTAILGHTVNFEQVPHERARSYGEDIAAMFAYFRTTGLDVDTAALRAEFPEIGWHTFSQWLETCDWSAATRP